MPFVDLRRLVDAVRDEVLADWEGVLDRCELVLGPGVARLEARLCEVLGVRHVVACHSGTDALRIAIDALDLPPASAIALPTLTFWASYEALVQLGHVPVLLDVDPSDLQLAFDEVRVAHDRHRLRAVVLPHLFGWASHRLADLRAFCRTREIALVEDAAQAFGVELDGAPLLSGAEVASLSFYPAKVVGGAMDGGAIVTASAALADRARSLRDHGRSAHYAFERVGWSSRMGGLQAAWLHRVLDRLPWILGTRRAALARYADAIASMPIELRGPPSGVVGNGYLAVVTARDGEALAAALQAEGIGTSRAYPSTIDQQVGAGAAVVASELVHARAFCRRVVDLPLFAGITEDETARVLEALDRVLDGGAR